MNNPTEYLGSGITASMNAHGGIYLTHAATGNYILIPKYIFPDLIAFRGRAQCEIALRQSLEPAFRFIEQKKI